MRTLVARATALLARREHSVVELRRKLKATGATVVEVDTTVAELTTLGLLSDARFADALVRQKQGTTSKRAIAGALRAKGVGDDAAKAALAVGEFDDDAALLALWRRRYGAPPANKREEARQVRFLQSRGFALAAIFKLLRSPPPADD